MGDGIKTLLEGLGASNLIPEFIDNEINLNNLSDLTEPDLIALGVEDPKLRQNVMKHVTAKPNTNSKSQYLPLTAEYTKAILGDINRHMLVMESTILGAYFKLNKGESRPFDPLVAPNLYSSQAAHQSMKIINKNLNDLEKQLNEFENLITKI